MMPVIRNPRHWLARRVENSKKDQDAFDDSIEPQRTMRKASVITHRRPNATDPGNRDRHHRYTQAGKRK
jgi:hypothetical protein